MIWRKVVEAKNSGQAAAIVSLKALHIQYDQAADQVAQQKAQAAAAKEKQKIDDAELPAKFFSMLVGSWKLSSSHEPGTFNEDDDTYIVTFLNLTNTTILAQFENLFIVRADGQHWDTVYSLSFNILPPNHLTQNAAGICVSQTYNRKPEKDCKWKTPDGLEFTLIDSTHLQAVAGKAWEPWMAPPYVFVKSFE